MFRRFSSGPGIPIVGSIGGFAAIVAYFLIWSIQRDSQWLLHVAAVAAVCGAITIFVEIANAS